MSVPAVTSGQADEPTLLMALRSREDAALERLVTRYGRALARAAWVWLGDPAAAEEAAQDALIAAWDGARRTDERTALRPWLFGILCNTCRKHQRSAARRRTREGAAAAEWTARRTTAPDARLTHLRDALDGLDDDLREVVVLRYLEELSVAEAAQALAIPEGTVKSRTHTALARLRERLERAS